MNKHIDDWARVERVTSPVKLWAHDRLRLRSSLERIEIRFGQRQASPRASRYANFTRILKNAARQRERQLQVSALMKIYPLLSEAEITALITLHLNLEASCPKR